MRLAIDIGNTAIKVGSESNGVLILDAVLPTRDFMRAPELLYDKIDGRPDFVAIASVVPDLADEVEGACLQSGIPYRRLTAKSAPGIEIRYETPSTLGADRIANALALQEQVGRPAASVDFGTATKIDVVDGSGTYLGGAILPGPLMMMEALAGGTALLSAVDLRIPEKALGRSTEGSLLSGTVLALGKAVDGLIGAMERELDTELRIIATGGLAERFAATSVRCGQVDPLLTLKGLLVAVRRWSEAS